MAVTRIAAVAAHFGTGIARALDKITGIVDRLAADGVDLLVLPDATLGGYIGDLRNPDPATGPEAIDPDGPEIRLLCRLAGAMTICVGYAEHCDGTRYNAAVCLTGDGVLGRHRKVHQPAGEHLAYSAGDRFFAFDTPVGRLGMLIDYDKTFPESARTLALDGARTIAALSAWPASVTDRASRMPNDRQSRLFDLYDQARAAENQVVLASSNQTGITGSLRFLGQAKVVGPGGDILAKTWSKGGLAVADIDVDAEVERARRVLRHLAERRVDAYHNLMTGKGGY
ncbi:carbon-nitrogen hydrolase family protein [Nocardia nova]|uniref:Carbon-nitrogen hydrolase family protein n=1 Tax=Nocardia nova TaxID=37330 RepID=A0A2S6AL33_9NOCA|nr:carbon-nitrogen hydrolase family protein [Nocardia nova]PPJ31692.1 carbon-nitrogen hydrolase family protein [Nocardia nova]PPJ35932.1 carbon-nitrogen hydrolase family protein [Nocardia nova]